MILILLPLKLLLLLLITIIFLYLGWHEILKDNLHVALVKNKKQKQKRIIQN